MSWLENRRRGKARRAARVLKFVEEIGKFIAAANLAFLAWRYR